MRSRLLALVLSAGVLAGVAAVPAGAVNVPQDRVVSANPADWVPWATNGRVYALVPIGTTMYVGGTFTQAQEPNATTFARPYLFAFDMTTGAISKTFKPSLDGAVNALATDGTSLFVGGDFTTVNGASHHRIVALDAAGAVVGGLHRRCHDGLDGRRPRGRQRPPVRGGRLHAGERDGAQRPRGGGSGERDARARRQPGLHRPAQQRRVARREDRRVARTARRWSRSATSPRWPVRPASRWPCSISPARRRPSPVGARSGS